MCAFRICRTKVGVALKQKSQILGSCAVLEWVETESSCLGEKLLQNFTKFLPEQSLNEKYIECTNMTMMPV